MITRSQSGIVKPIDHLFLNTLLISPIPKNPSNALKDPHWCNAMYDEYNALIKNGTWLLVSRLAGVNIVRSMQLFKHKFHANGTLSHYKARLVASGGLFLSQRKYTLQLLERAHMVNCNPSRTPVDTESKLGLDGFRFSSADLPLYARSARVTFSCSQTYLATCSGLSIYTQLYLSVEAEYQGVANVVAETAWLRNLLYELHSPLSTATLVYYDNISAVYMSVNHVRVLHVPSRFQYADIFTNGLPSALFEEFRSSLSVRPPPAPTAGAY
ncbi:ribonuclease H-like domain-containing protein [Tanacetum coccineum]